MCGRYAITLPPEAVRNWFGYLDQPNFPPRYNVAPTQPVPIVECDLQGQRRFALVRWGLIPPFVKDPKGFPLLIQARLEGILYKPSFRGALRHRRCLFIADGWYEWRKERAGGKDVRKPYLFGHRDGLPLGIAALAQTWSDPMGGEIETGCPITVPASGAAAAIGPRMPAIVSPDCYDAWLDTRGVRAQDAIRIIDQMDVDAIECVAVGDAVNRVANDGPDLFAKASG